MLLCVTGCTRELDKTTVTTEVVKATSDELVSEEYFLEYYGLTREDIGDFDLQAMIVHYSINEETLIEKRDFCLRELNESIEIGKDFNCYASNYVREEYKRRATKEDDLNQAKYIILEYDILGDGGFDYPRQILIHIEKNKIYYADSNVWNDFSKADVIKELEDAQMDKIMTDLIDMDIYKWKPGSTGAKGDKLGDYNWELFIIMGRGDVIAYSGGNLGDNENFEVWYNELLEVVK